jgi:hypothetical protein
MTIDDAEHYTPERRAEIVAGYLPHEREARAKGIPVLGSGRIFPIEENKIVIDPISIPVHWPQINGLDFGYDHPFAAINLAWDRDSDCVYLCKEYAEREATPVVHAASVKPWGKWIPCAWPHDGLQHDKGSGVVLKTQYQAQGLEMLSEKAEWPEGGNSVEAGLIDMLDRMKTGRFKVFSSLTGWLSEFRLYHRKDGQIVKLKDDRISASRYGVMMLRHAITKPKPDKLIIPSFGAV